MTPVPDTEEMKAFHEALAEGRLIVRHCRGCGENHHYPRSYCPFCGSGETEWTMASGLGEVYSTTSWRMKDEVTFPAFVTLAEGPSLLALLADGRPGGIGIGDRVRIAPEQIAGGLPLFVRAE